MTPRAGRPFGDEPDDAEGAGHDESVGGWVPPEERVWRHPSEVAASSTPGRPPAGAPFHGPAPSRSGARAGRRATATVGIGIGAAAAVVTGVILLVNTGFSQPPATNAPPLLTASEGCCRSVPGAAAGAERALVSLRVSGPNGPREVCGVAFAAGGLVVTTADALSGARSVTAMGSRGGWTPATVIGRDPTADVAVVRVAGELPSARFADDTALSAGRPAMVMAEAPRQGASGAATLWGGTAVQRVGTAITAGTGQGLAAITTTRVPVPAVAGEVLVDRSGAVVGLLDTAATSAGQQVFLPGRFVAGVAEQLLRSGRVTHGWLDVALANVAPGATVTTTAAPASPSRGAKVVAVMANGASAGVLSPGDVIVGVNGQPVRSMAELRSRLYVMAAGTPVRLDVWRGAQPRSVDIALSPSP